ncbi:MAG: hypothetical protein IPO64_13280 [Bacteroidetes bacterium]|nr:hypothetical protein [Bacteroidota bacterium]
MTKEEFFKEHQNNEDLIKELDEVINVLKDCGNPIPYFGIHMKQLKLDLYLYGVYKDEKISNRHNYLLAILVDLKIVDKFQSSSNDENSTYKIKSSAVLSESLLEQFIQWKTEQKHKNTPNIVENYTNSNVIKGSSFPRIAITI